MFLLKEWMFFLVISLLHIDINKSQNAETDHVEGEDDAEVAQKELLDLVDRYEKRSQPNIAPLESNLGKSLSPR